MNHLYTFEGFVGWPIRESYDLISALNNFLHHGRLPWDKWLLENQSNLISIILDSVDRHWYEYDVDFSEHGVSIEGEKRKIQIDASEGCIRMGTVLYFPRRELRELCDRIYAIRQEKMTVAGTHLLKR